MTSSKMTPQIKTRWSKYYVVWIFSRGIERAVFPLIQALCGCGLGYFVLIYWLKNYTNVIPQENDVAYSIARTAFYWIDGLVQDCSISIANAMEIQQSYTKPSTSYFHVTWKQSNDHRNASPSMTYMDGIDLGHITTKHTLTQTCPMCAL